MFSPRNPHVLSRAQQEDLGELYPDEELPGNHPQARAREVQVRGGRLSRLHRREGQTPDREGITNQERECMRTSHLKTCEGMNNFKEFKYQLK